MSKKLLYARIVVGMSAAAICVVVPLLSWHLYSKDFSIKVSAQDQVNDENCDLIDFRYLIVNDSKFGPKSRDIMVFMDKNVFSEDNLTKLFARLAPRYSDTKILSIIVLTDWEQFSDCSASGRGGGADQKPFDFNLLEARYYRDETREHFTYIPKPGKNFVKVDLKKK
jgi:hypothetical protein